MFQNSGSPGQARGRRREQSLMELKKQEQDFQFSLWLIASILLHLLLFLIFLIWYFERSLQERLMHKNPEFKTVPLSPQQLQQQKEEEKKQTPVLWKDLKKPEKQPEKKEDLVYTLVPGRQAVTQADPTKPEAKPEPEKKAPEQKTKQEESKPRSEISHSPAPEPIPQKQEAPKQESHPEAKRTQPLPSKPRHNVSQSQAATREPAQPIPAKQEPKPESQHQPQPKTTSQRHDDIKEKIVQEPKPNLYKPKENDQLVSEISSDPSKKTDTNNPTIVKNKVTLQDLQLGFAKYMQEGNNDILLQRGNTNQPPDAAALRLITYQQQLAHTMREAIIAHHQYYLVENIRGTRPTYSITIDRSGKLVSFSWIKGSGSDILDKVMNEALQGIRLYPAMPQYVLGDTFSHAWTFMH